MKNATPYLIFTWFQIILKMCEEEVVWPFFYKRSVILIGLFYVRIDRLMTMKGVNRPKYFTYEEC